MCILIKTHKRDYINREEFYYYYVRRLFWTSAYDTIVFKNYFRLKLSELSDELSKLSDAVYSKKNPSNRNPFYHQNQSVGQQGLEEMLEDVWGSDDDETQSSIHLKDETDPECHEDLFEKDEDLDNLDHDLRHYVMTQRIKKQRSEQSTENSTQESSLGYEDKDTIDNVEDRYEHMNEVTQHDYDSLLEEACGSEDTDKRTLDDNCVNEGHLNMVNAESNMDVSREDVDELKQDDRIRLTHDKLQVCR